MDAMKERCWFHAREPGRGWSFPAARQGWRVPVLYASGTFAAGCRLLPVRFGGFPLAIGTLSLLRVGTCLIKGEPLHD